MSEHDDNERAAEIDDGAADTVVSENSVTEAVQFAWSMEDNAPDIVTRPGWFPDPVDPSRQRYFDGRAWTDNYAPFDPPAPTVGRPSKTGMSLGRRIGIAVVRISAAILIYSIGTSLLNSIGNNSGENPSASSNTGSVIGTVNVAPTTTKNGFTTAQTNAIAKAKIYLSFPGGISKKHLIEQLVEFDKFSSADAKFAVEQIEATGGVNWNEEAVKAAKFYLNNGGPLSKYELVHQLKFDGFTSDQAEYGANVAYGG